LDLLSTLTKKCPKRGEKRLLVCTEKDGVKWFARDELEAYRVWLRLPWPRKDGEQRPHLPTYIKKEIMRESHLRCAICGDMNNGEVAHIDGVASTMDNSPFNLIFLCPNHHTQYDYGYKASSNVSREELLAAKAIKRASQKRMLLWDRNRLEALKAVIDLVKGLEERAHELDAPRRGLLVTEVNALQSLIDQADAASEADQLLDTQQAVAMKAPTLAKLVAPSMAPSLQPSPIEYISFNDNIVISVISFDVASGEWRICLANFAKGHLSDLKRLITEASTKVPVFIASSELGRGTLAPHISYSNGTIVARVQHDRLSRRSNPHNLKMTWEFDRTGDLARPLRYVGGIDAVWSYIHYAINTPLGGDPYNLAHGTRWRDLFWEKHPPRVREKLLALDLIRASFHGPASALRLIDAVEKVAVTYEDASAATVFLRLRLSVSGVWEDTISVALGDGPVDKAKAEEEHANLRLLGLGGTKVVSFDRPAGYEDFLLDILQLKDTVGGILLDDLGVESDDLVRQHITEAQQEGLLHLTEPDFSGNEFIVVDDPDALRRAIKRNG
jgi:hypothetical protein